VSVLLREATLMVSASVAPPRLAALLDRDVSDEQGYEGVEPPRAEKRVTEQADQQRSRKVSAKQVLLALAGRGRRPYPRPDPPLGASEPGLSARVPRMGAAGIEPATSRV
jgi:hypothetical protein